MSINEIYPMRKRRSVNKTPGKTPKRLSSNDVPLQTPKRITSNTSFSECEIVWDNHSPSPSRTLLGKRKKKTASDEDGSDNNDIADLVKKLANKTGQTPQDSSLYNFWFNEQDSQSGSRANNSGDKKIIETPARRPTRKGRKSKARLNKELEVLASMMKNNESNVNTAVSIKTEENSSPTTHQATATSPLTSHQQTTSPIKPTRINSKFKTPTNHKDTKKLRTTITPNFSSPLSDVTDIDWGDDDDVDTMLSQVDISALCEQEVITNTQQCDSKSADASVSNFKENQQSWGNDNSLVTESWDFDDDSDELIQTLEQVEKTQSISFDNKVFDMEIKSEKREILLNPSSDQNDKGLFNTLQVEKMHNVQVGKACQFDVQIHKQNVSQYEISELGNSSKIHKQNVGLSTKLEDKGLQVCKQNNIRQVTEEKSSVLEQSCDNQLNCKYSKEDIERKRLEAQQKRKQRLKLANTRMNSRQNTYRSKR